MTAGTDLRPPRVEPPKQGAPRRQWWRRPWIGPLGLVIVAFLAYSLPPYLAFDPARSRVPAPEGFAAHYWFLVAHVLFGSVAMIGALVQVWPWVRRRFPQVHRYAGRAYVFAGVIPSGLMALTIGAASPFGPATRASDVMLAVLWLGVTWAGWRAARERRFGDQPSGFWPARLQREPKHHCCSADSQPDGNAVLEDRQSVSNLYLATNT